MFGDDLANLSRVKHVKLIGLCLVAVFALVAVAASSAAAAEPEWAGCVKLAKAKGNFTEEKCQTVATKLKKGKAEPDHKGAYEVESGLAATCVAQKDGNYTESQCETVAGKTKKGVFTPDHKGKYEKATQDKFSGEGGAGVLSLGETSCVSNESSIRKPRQDCTEAMEGNGDGKLYCTSEHNTGEATGMNEVTNVSVRFKGCEFFGLPSQTPGLPAGEIQVNQLKGRLGYINKANHEVGVLLEPAAAGGSFASVEVLNGDGLITVGVGNATEGSFYEAKGTPGTPNGGDGIISPITPVNTMTRTFTQEYRVKVTTEECAEKPEWEPNCGDPEYYGKNEEYTQSENTPNHFEGGPLKTLEGWLEFPAEKVSGMWNSAGEEITNVNTVSSGYAEIKG